MDLRDTADEAAFRAEVRAFIEENAPSRERGARRFEETDREWSRKLGAAGYAGLTWPKEFGGAGAPYSHQAIFLEELARAEAPSHLGVIGLGMAGPTIIAWGTPEQKAKVTSDVVNEDLIRNLAHQLGVEHLFEDDPRVDELEAEVARLQEQVRTLKATINVLTATS